MFELQSVDLNLWLVLGHLLQTSSVSVTAQKLGKTQSAISHSLRQLREIFSDRLFVRVGGTLQPTPRAQALQPLVRQALDAMTASLRPRADFSPASLERTFRLALSDHAQVVILPRLLARLAEVAPKVELDVTFRAESREALIFDVRDERSDLLVTAAGIDAAGLITRQLYSDGYVVAVRADHPLTRRMTVEEWARADHIVASPRGCTPDRVDAALSERGLHRRVAARVPHYVAALSLVATSDLVTLVPSRLARKVASHSQLALLEPPVEIPPFTLAAYTSELLRDDPVNAWLRGEVAAATREPAAPKEHARGATS